MQHKPPAAVPELGQFRLRSECISRFSQCVNKMEVRYRETRSDFIRWHRLNKTRVMSQWRSYLMVALALLPTSLLLWAYQATYAALWMSMATVFMLAWAGYRYFVPLVRFPLSEHIDVFDRHVGKRENSETRSGNGNGSESKRFVKPEKIFSSGETTLPAFYQNVRCRRISKTKCES